MKNFFIVINKKKIISFFICLCLLFTHIFLYLKIDNYNNILESINKEIFNSFNFTEEDSIESDTNIFFVFNLNDFINLGTSKPKLQLPSGEEYEQKNGEFIFNLKTNLVVKCAGSGIVKDIGYLENGLKFVEIRHSGNFITRYENLKIVGVGQNFNVKAIHILGTCEEETPFVFKILKNNKIVNNYIIENGKILWQN